MANKYSQAFLITSNDSPEKVSMHTRLCKEEGNCPDILTLEEVIDKY